MNQVVKFVLPPALIIASIAAVILLAINRPEPEEREVTQSAMLVDVIEAEQARDHFTVEAQGTVRPRTETTIVPEVNGKIVRVSEAFAAGGFFRAGHVLIEIDPSDYEAALKQAEADLASARARLSEESARSEQARRDWQKLHGSDREPGQLVLRLPQLANAKAAVQAAEAAVMQASRNLERTRISLPYDGMIRSRQVDLGQYVSPGTTLGVAFAVDVAEVRLPLADRDLAFLDLPQPGRDSSDASRSVRLYGDAGGQRGGWPARIVRTEGIIEESTRLTYAVAEIQDPYGLLDQERSVPLPMGTYVRAEIHGRSAAGLIELPREALRGGDRVFLANGDDELEIRHVEVIRATAQRVFLHNDIHPGDRVITTAIQAPIPGSALRVRETESLEPELRVLPPESVAAAEENEQ